MANEGTLQRVRDATESTDTTTADIDAAQGNWSTPETGQETVSTAGTAEQFNGGTSLSVPDGSELLIRALPGNTDTVYIGDDTVSASTGHAIGPSDPPIALPIDDVSAFWIDVAVGGEGVSWVVVVSA